MEVMEPTAATTDWRVALLTDREKTLTRLYARTYPMVLHYVKQHGGTEEDAQDLLQDAMIVFYEKTVLDQLTLTASVSTYLMGICKNRWRREFEKRNRRTGLQPEPEEGIWEEPETEQASLKLMDYVEQLGERCKDLLVSVYYFGQRMEELAERYGYRTVHSATVQKYKCLERLRKAVSHLSIGQFK